MEETINVVETVADGVETIADGSGVNGLVIVGVVAGVAALGTAAFFGGRKLIKAIKNRKGDDLSNADAVVCEVIEVEDVEVVEE